MRTIDALFRPDCISRFNPDWFASATLQWRGKRTETTRARKVRSIDADVFTLQFSFLLLYFFISPENFDSTPKAFIRW